MSKITFVTADLGRHIMNGKILVEQGHFVDTNYYSFTQPDFPVVNHHWGAGVLFYWVERLGGFPALSIFSAVLGTLAVLLVFLAARVYAGVLGALLPALLAAPLFVSRPEVRPELVSYFFLGAILYLLVLFRENRLSGRWLLLLPVLQAVWINVHIFFPFGLFLIFLFFLDAALVAKDTEKAKALFWTGAAAGVACLLNPYHIWGVLEPFLIFDVYGYPVQENQPFGHILRGDPGNPLHWHLILYALLLLGLGVGGLQRHWRSRWLALTLVLTSLLLLSVHYRAVTLFALFSIFAGGIFLAQSRLIVGQSTRIRAIGWGLALALVLSGLLLRQPYYSPYRTLQLEPLLPAAADGPFWLPAFIRNLPQWPGLMPGVNDAAQFFKEEGLTGPVFNDYDIGGYLIYHLFPENRVFVDNRPEAYKEAFFTDLYIPMQEDPEVWRAIDGKIDFNVIFFFRNDRTEWGRAFLQQRLHDPAWRLVYIDPYSLIFLKNQE